jgi:aspartokinase
MTKLRLGGIKAFERRAYLTSLCRSGEDALGDICSRLAADRINLSLLTHIADKGTREAITAACTEGVESFSGYIHWKASHGHCNIGKLLTDISVISIFPHDQKLNVTGSLMRALAENRIRPYGLASSPSAMTVLVSSLDFESAIYGLFEVFEFPTYSSPLDWHAAYGGQEELLNEIVCSYQEEIIKIYNITHQSDLNLWTITLPLECLGDFGTILLQLDETGLRIPFLVSKSSPDEDGITFALCFAAAYRERVEQVVARNLPNIDLSWFGPVSVVFLHGPHFGDRYGITNALLKVLRNAGIPPLAMSCAVSSMSVVVRGNDTNRTIEAISSSFQTPLSSRRASEKA